MCKGESILTLERLREVLRFDPETGYFHWIAQIKNGKPRPHAGYLRPDGYIRIEIDGNFFRAHRLVWFWMHGKWPEHLLDHINGERSDNRPSNLREADFSQNQWNKGPNRRNVSGMKGVSYHNDTNRWIVSIRYRGKRKHLGSFESPDEAREIYCLAADLLHGEFANYGRRALLNGDKHE